MTDRTRQSLMNGSENMAMNPDELVKKWEHRLELTTAIPTWTEPHALAYCAEIASRSLFMVELGTYMGASAAVMLNANPRLHLWCVDTFEVFGTEKITRMFLWRPISEGRCELIVGNSERAAGMLPHMRGKLDAVWVDDGHATEDVKRDISCFLPLLKSGGILFGHDFDIPFNDVAIGVKASLPTWDIPVPRVWSYTKP